MPGKEASAPAPLSPEAAADQLRQIVTQLLKRLPDDASAWLPDERRKLGQDLSALANDLRFLGAGQIWWEPLLELSTSLGRLSPNGRFPPPPRGPLLEKTRKVLKELAATVGPLTTPIESSKTSKEKPDVPYTQMLLRKLGSQ